MTSETRSPAATTPRRIGAWLILLGGLVNAAATLLPWFYYDQPNILPPFKPHRAFSALGSLIETPTLTVPVIITVAALGAVLLALATVVAGVWALRSAAPAWLTVLVVGGVVMQVLSIPLGNWLAGPMSIGYPFIYVRPDVAQVVAGVADAIVLLGVVAYARAWQHAPPVGATAA